MIADLRPYPAYRESELRWLERIPSHWDVLRAKSLFREIDERSSTGKEDLLSVSHIRGVTKRSETNATMFLAKSNKGHKICRPGDLVINTMWAWMGALAVSPHTGLVSPSYGTYRPIGRNALLAGYAHQLLRTPQYVSEYISRSTGIHSSRLRLYPEQFLCIPLLCPSNAEQVAIVTFLNHANGRIEEAIRTKKKLIALLNEQKQAIIHRVVARGINPNVSFKPSGFAELGDIPEHWKVVPLKYLSRSIQNGKTPPTAEQGYYENGSVPWFGPSSVGTRIEVDRPVRYLSPLAFSDGQARLIDGPAVLVIVIGATAGRVGLLPGEGATNQQITAFELRIDQVVAEFVAMQLRLSETWLRSTASTATIPILDSGTVARLLLACPGLTEQRCILDRLAEETSPLDIAMKYANRETLSCGNTGRAWSPRWLQGNSTCERPWWGCPQRKGLTPLPRRKKTEPKNCRRQ